ncbi:FkbM family methyltransferase [Sphingomonas sp.]|uniref:FkbM family methyltransferase n=1 Tax=Sphingomonas sp. TaxID=28214 RepID=UPI001B0916B6|nr:FkbM family methyltransferase [Sphingomonas sp.]MBO9712549.1 FkbM family methyltransferase [Sphingomonas sp.]
MRLSGILKPEYLHRPGNLLRRLRYAKVSPGAQVETRVFGEPFRVWPAEVVGRQILYFGLYDLTVTEALWRLADRGEQAVDVGANIGYTAALLLNRVGASGRVTAFEAHPGVFAELRANVARRRNADRVTCVHAAVSSRAGHATLHIPRDFADNHGIASLETLGEDDELVTVEAVTLDAALGEAGAVGVLKIDVEGHELAVLDGAAGLLARHGVRDVVFEDHQPEQSRVAARLHEAGYALFHLQKMMGGVTLVPLGEPVTLSPWEPPNLLATVDPARARARFAKGGWFSLKG